MKSENSYSELKERACEILLEEKSHWPEKRKQLRQRH